METKAPVAVVCLIILGFSVSRHTANGRFMPKRQMTDSEEQSFIASRNNNILSASKNANIINGILKSLMKDIGSGKRTSPLRRKPITIPRRRHFHTTVKVMNTPTSTVPLPTFWAKSYRMLTTIPLEQSTEQTTKATTFIAPPNRNVVTIPLPAFWTKSYKVLTTTPFKQSTEQTTKATTFIAPPNQNVVDTVHKWLQQYGLFVYGTEKPPLLPPPPPTTTPSPLTTQSTTIPPHLLIKDYVITAMRKPTTPSITTSTTEKLTTTTVLPTTTTKTTKSPVTSSTASPTTTSTTTVRTTTTKSQETSSTAPPTTTSKTTVRTTTSPETTSTTTIQATTLPETTTTISSTTSPRPLTTTSWTTTASPETSTTEAPITTHIPTTSTPATTVKPSSPIPPTNATIVHTTPHPTISNKVLRLWLLNILQRICTTTPRPPLIVNLPPVQTTSSPNLYFLKITAMKNYIENVIRYLETQFPQTTPMPPRTTTTTSSHYTPPLSRKSTLLRRPPPPPPPPRVDIPRHTPMFLSKKSSTYKIKPNPPVVVEKQNVPLRPYKHFVISVDRDQRQQFTPSGFQNINASLRRRRNTRQMVGESARKDRELFHSEPAEQGVTNKMVNITGNSEKSKDLTPDLSFLRDKEKAIVNELLKFRADYFLDKIKNAENTLKGHHTTNEELVKQREILMENLKSLLQLSNRLVEKYKKRYETNNIRTEIIPRDGTDGLKTKEANTVTQQELNNSKDSAVRKDSRNHNESNIQNDDDHDIKANPLNLKRFTSKMGFESSTTTTTSPKSVAQIIQFSDKSKKEVSNVDASNVIGTPSLTFVNMDKNRIMQSQPSQFNKHHLVGQNNQRIKVSTNQNNNFIQRRKFNRMRLRNINRYPQRKQTDIRKNSQQNHISNADIGKNSRHYQLNNVNFGRNIENSFHTYSLDRLSSYLNDKVKPNEISKPSNPNVDPRQEMHNRGILTNLYFDGTSMIDANNSPLNSPLTIPSSEFFPYLIAHRSSQRQIDENQVISDGRTSMLKPNPHVLQNFFNNRGSNTDSGLDKQQNPLVTKNDFPALFGHSYRQRSGDIGNELRHNDYRMDADRKIRPVLKDNLYNYIRHI